MTISQLFDSSEKIKILVLKVTLVISKKRQVTHVIFTYSQNSAKKYFNWYLLWDEVYIHWYWYITYRTSLLVFFLIIIHVIMIIYEKLYSLLSYYLFNTNFSGNGNVSSSRLVSRHYFLKQVFSYIIKQRKTRLLIQLFKVDYINTTERITDKYLLLLANHHHVPLTPQARKMKGSKLYFLLLLCF